MTIAETTMLRRRALNSLDQLPPFSPILNRLLADFAREDVSFARVSELIEKDTILAGNVLRMVNSALYGRLATVNSVRHAVSLLGVTKLRNATLSMSVTRMWNQVRVPAGWSMARFNLHGVATGMLTDVIAQSAAVEDVEGAFAAGLFHDLGSLLIAIGLPKEHEQIVLALSKGDGSRSDREMELLGFTHAELSAEALAKWNLPDAIRNAVLHHHDPVEPRDGEAQISLSRAVAAADAYVNAAGYSVAPSRPRSTEQAEAGLEALGLTQPVRKLIDDFTREFESIRAMF